jgi:hypothetical protein
MFGANKNKDGKLPGPCGIPEPVGRHMVIAEKGDPDLVWNLKAVVHPTDNKKIFYCRVYNETQTGKSGIKVQDWSSLDGHRELIIWEGYYNKESMSAQRKDFEEPAKI